jgi:hypothetical protein
VYLDAKIGVTPSGDNGRIVVYHPMGLVAIGIDVDPTMSES